MNIQNVILLNYQKQTVPHIKVLLNSFHLNGHTLGFHPLTQVTTTLIDSRFDSESERVKKLERLVFID